MSSLSWRPRLAVTMGDVAGIGPEVAARVCSDPSTLEWCQPVVVGHPEILARALRVIGQPDEVLVLDRVDDEIPSAPAPACWNPGDDAVLTVEPGRIDARAGQAAYDYLTHAAKAALAGQIDGLTTCPLHKMALRQAGVGYPGHTEILADLCGVDHFAMMLYLPPGNIVRGPQGLAVVHVTLHTSLASVPGLISTAGILEKTRLISSFLETIGCVRPRVGVCALNPHAGEEGLFGDEEQRLIAPAVQAACRAGISAGGPYPADTLLKRAVEGEFDGVVAMYHDQGHIAFKLVGFHHAVNVTLGLPIVRTSPSHGTAFDIAWKGQADARGLFEALRMASLLAKKRHANAHADSFESNNATIEE